MVACIDFFEMSEICRPKFIVRHSTLNHDLLKLSQMSNEKIFVCDFYLFVLLITLFDIHLSFLLQIENFIIFIS
jgi:hypothetical protein